MRKEAQDMKQRELRLSEVLLAALDIVKRSASAASWL